MIVKFEFTLPEERSEHALALAGPTNFGALWDFGEFLRRLTKDEELHGGEALALLDRIQAGWEDATASVNWEVE